MSIPSQAALVHLRTIKPQDGWSVKKDEKGFRLLRRNVPLFDNYFHDIHYCPKKEVVVGVLTQDGSTCQILVDERGVPVSSVKVISVSTYDPSSAKGASFSQSRARAAEASTGGSTRTSMASSSTGTGATGAFPDLNDEQNKEIVKYGLMAVGGVAILRILSSSVMLYLVLLPLVYFYGLNTCPSIESFDAKKELKRVLRGHHLPEDHPNKPRGFFEEMAARVTASVAAELVTFPGYELQMTSLGGAAWIADVRVPTAKTQCYWVGVFGRWHYVTSFEIPETHTD